MTVTWPGIERFPQLPFRRLFTPLSRPVPEDAEIVTAYTDGQVTKRSNRSKIGYHEAADLSGYQGVARGDFVVHGLDILRGSVGVSDSSGAMSSVCTVCTPSEEVDPRYVAHAIRLQAASGFTRALARGVREGGADFRRWATLAELPIPVPPLAEQRAIADYLDRETAQIDALIAKQEQLIVTLRERRRAVTAHLTVRGLDRAVALKDSGLSWVGQVPAHWSVVPTKSVLRLKKELVGDAADERNLLSLTTRGVIPRDTSTSEGKFPANFDTYQLLTPGDLVFCLFDVDETPRTVGLTVQPGMITGAYTRFGVNQQIANPRFLLAYFTAIDDEKRFRPLYSGLRKVIQKSRFLSAGLALPPLEEQHRIVAELDAQTAQIDELIAKAEQFIALAKERRAALITAAVTGQIAVPDFDPADRIDASDETTKVA